MTNKTLTAPTFTTPALGTPASGVLTNVSGTASSLTAGNVTTNANLTGVVTSSGNATAIADKALAIAKLADGTDGELITWNASGVIAAVAVGSADQVLTSNGTGAAPTFQAAAGGITASHAGVAKGYVRVAGDGALQSGCGEYNVSSTSKQGTGYFQIVWDTDFADALYSSSMVIEQASAMGNIQVRAIATTHVDTQSFDACGTAGDAAIQVIAFGDQ